MAVPQLFNCRFFFGATLFANPGTNKYFLPWLTVIVSIVNNSKKKSVAQLYFILF